MLWHTCFIVSNTESDLCPVVVCENDGVIPDECRKPQFVTGYDGETLCKICDASFCGEKTAFDDVNDDDDNYIIVFLNNNYDKNHDNLDIVITITFKGSSSYIFFIIILHIIIFV